MTTKAQAMNDVARGLAAATISNGRQFKDDKAAQAFVTSALRCTASMMFDRATPRESALWDARNAYREHMVCHVVREISLSAMDQYHRRKANEQMAKHAALAETLGVA